MLKSLKKYNMKLLVLLVIIMFAATSFIMPPINTYAQDEAPADDQINTYAQDEAPADDQFVSTDTTATTTTTTASGALGPVTSKDTIYQILTDRFDDGDTTNNIPSGFNSNLFDGTGNNMKLFQGGDWQGIIDRIPYLVNLGVTAVWISAPYEGFDSAVDGWTSYHGYHARNYFAPNKHFGNMSDFIALKNALHNNGIKLVIDVVTNHTSNRQIDGKLYEPDKDSSGNYVFSPSGDPVDYNNDGKVENLIADPNAGSNNPLSWWFHQVGNRADNQTSKFDFRHKDLANLGDFSQEYSTVVDHLEKVLKFWKTKGIDGFRHDATKHENVAFDAGLRDAVDSASGGPLTHFGEFFISRPDSKYDEYKDFPKRTGINNLDFEFYNSASSTFGSFSNTMADFGNMMLYTSNDYDIENQAVSFIDNHDVKRFRNLQPNDKPFHAGLVALMTARGIPCIYYGTEQYINGATNDEGRAFMEKKYSFNQQTTAFRLIKKLSDLRKTNDAIAYGLTSILYSSDNVLVYSRKFYNKEVVVAINRQPDISFTVPAISTTLPAGTYSDSLEGLLSGQGATVSNNTISSFTLSGGQVNIWSSNPDLGSSPKIGDVQAYTGRPGNRVYIFGTGLDGNITVNFGTTAATVVSNTSTKIEAVVPNVSAGVKAITVTKNGNTSNSFNYTVLGGDLVQVIFHVSNATTFYGQNVYVVGSIPELGSWDPAKSSESAMNPNYPEWFLPVSVPKNTTISYKFIKKDDSGNVVWESINNRTVTSPSSDTGTVDVYCNWNTN